MLLICSVFVLAVSPGQNEHSEAVGFAGAYACTDCFLYSLRVGHAQHSLIVVAVYMELPADPGVMPSCLLRRLKFAHAQHVEAILLGLSLQPKQPFVC